MSDDKVRDLIIRFYRDTILNRPKDIFTEVINILDLVLEESTRDEVLRNYKYGDPLYGYSVQYRGQAKRSKCNEVNYINSTLDSIYVESEVNPVASESIMIDMADIFMYIDKDEFLLTVLDSIEDIYEVANYIRVTQGY